MKYTPTAEGTIPFRIGSVVTTKLAPRGTTVRGIVNAICKGTGYLFMTIIDEQDQDDVLVKVEDISIDQY